MGFVRNYIRTIEKIWPLIILIWLGMFIWGVIDGPKFLKSTDNIISSTKGTESYIAEQYMNDFFPQVNDASSFIIIVQCDPKMKGSCTGTESPVISKKTEELLRTIESDVKTHYPTLFHYDQTASYFHFQNTPYAALSAKYLSIDGETTLMMLEANTKENQFKRFDAYRHIRNSFKKVKHLCPDCYLGITGPDPITDDVTNLISENILKSDMILIPIASVILIYMIKSWRLALISLFCMATSILSAFAITYRLQINCQSITAQFVEVIVIALSIDYGLFLFSRFNASLTQARTKYHEQRKKYLDRDSAGVGVIGSDMLFATSNTLTAPSSYAASAVDMLDLPHASDDKPIQGIIKVALQTTLRHSGHVITVSSITLGLCFAGFFLTKSSFLISTAIPNIIAISLCVLMNLTFPFAAVIAVPSFFTNYNPIPDVFYYCCCPARRKPQLCDTDWTGDQVEIDDYDESAYLQTLEAVQNEQFDREVSFSHNAYQFLGAGRGSTNAFTTSGTITPSKKPKSSRITLSSPNSRPSTNVDNYEAISRSKAASEFSKLKRSCWYTLGKLLTTKPYNLILLVLMFGGLAALASQVKDMKLSDSYDLGIPHSSPAKKGMDVIGTTFTPGLLQQLDVLVVYSHSDDKKSIDVQNNLFTIGHDVINALVAEMDFNIRQTSSVLYHNDKSVKNMEEATVLLDSDPVYVLTWRSTITKFEEMAKKDGGLRINLISNISLGNLSPFIGDLRKKVISVVSESISKKPELKDFSVHLAGGKVSEVDTVEETKNRFPLMIIITTVCVLVIVALLLQSVFVLVRLVVTLALPLVAVFGLSVLVYQRGILNWLGIAAFKQTSVEAFYWDIPIFAFVVLLGLSLDYDIFIISRIAEFRQDGYDGNSSVILGLSETGGIISAAGLIMTISFSALLMMDSDACRQTGFMLCVAIIMDTFIIRPLIVPIVMSFFDRISWWPRQVPMKDLINIDDVMHMSDPNSLRTYGAV